MQPSETPISRLEEKIDSTTFKAIPYSMSAGI
jgi:hypothetical protein